MGSAGGADKTLLGKVLIVDDDAMVCQLASFALRDIADIRVVQDGESCLAEMAEFEPDLILMDIQMPGMNGYDTCRQVLAQRQLPVLFLSVHDTLQDRLEAFDAGGVDFIQKPFDNRILKFKIKVALSNLKEIDRLAEQSDRMHASIDSAQRSVDENGILLGFIRSTIDCKDYTLLAARILDAASRYGARCHVQLRLVGAPPITLTEAGPASDLEESIFDQLRGMGEVFQFRTRLAVNRGSVSLLCFNMPTDDEAANERLRLNLVALAEGAEGVFRSVESWMESVQKTERLQVASVESYQTIEELRGVYRTHQAETRMMLYEMIQSVEKQYIFLGLTDRQESIISTMLSEHSEKILKLFEHGQAEMESRFNQLAEKLVPDNENNIELF